MAEDPGPMFYRHLDTTDTTADCYIQKKLSITIDSENKTFHDKVNLNNISL